MKKIISTLLFTTALFSSERVLSDIEATKNSFLDIDGEICDVECMKRLSYEKLYFSFLAKYPSLTQKDDELQELFINLSPILALYTPLNHETIKIAVLLPHKKIGGYAISTVNSMIAYLLSRNNKFSIEVFAINDENETTITQTLEQIRALEYKFLIAPLTTDGADILSRNSQGLEVFVPTVNKNLMHENAQNILYGGIDYKEQISLLAQKSNLKMATFSDGSVLAKMLDTFVAQEELNVVYSRDLQSARIDFKSFLKDNKRLEDSSIFVNMPLVKGSLLISQLRYNDVVPYAILSTQIGYHPMLLNLTQFEDREKLFIANSIDFVPTNLRVTNSLFGHSLEFDWVNYSTSIGIDIFYSSYFNQDATRVFKEEVEENQVKYNTKLYRAGRYQFYLD